VTNPNFNYSSTRYFAAYTEAVFTYMLFVDGLSQYPRRLDMDAARSFFQFGKMPSGFHRASQPLSSVGNAKESDELITSRPDITPGYNNGKVNSFIAQPLTASFDTCHAYEAFVELVVQLYPNTTGDLLNALKTNLHYFYEGFTAANCTEVLI